LQNGVRDTAQDIEHVKVVAETTEVISQTCFVHLCKVINGRIKDTDNESNFQEVTNRFFLLFCFYIINVNKIVVDSNQTHVKAMEGEAD